MTVPVLEAAIFKSFSPLITFFLFSDDFKISLNDMESIFHQQNALYLIFKIALLNKIETQT